MGRRVRKRQWEQDSGEGLGSEGMRSLWGEEIGKIPWGERERVVRWPWLRNGRKRRGSRGKKKACTKR